MRKVSYRRLFLVMGGLIVMVALAQGAAFAGDELYIRNSTVSDTPKVLLRLDNSLGDMPFKDNPALLGIPCPYEVFLDSYYRGSYSKISTSDVMISNGAAAAGPAAGAILGRSVLEGEYFSNYVGTDAGFAMKIGTSSTLAFIFNYLYGHVRGEGDIESWNIDSVGTPLYFWGNETDKFESNRYAPMVLFSTRPSPRLALGVGLGYAYITDYLLTEVSGPMLYVLAVGAPARGLWDSEETLRLKYHRFSPVFGVSFDPGGVLRHLGAWLGSDISFGSVHKDSGIASWNTLTGVYNVFSEDLDSRDLFGWKVRGGVEGTFGGPLTPLVFVTGSYSRFHWGVDGTATGDMEPDAYWAVYRGGGPIDYQNDATNWEITAGAKLHYNTDLYKLTFDLMYTRSYFRNEFTQANNVTWPGAQGPGVSFFTQDDRVTKDIVTVSYEMEIPLEDRLSVTWGAYYDYGWAHRDYDIFYRSGYDIAAGYLAASNSGEDQFQDVTVWLKTIYRSGNLSVTLSGMVKIPLDPIDYHMSGTAVNTDPASYRFYTSGIGREYEDSSWIYGGLLTLTYEFGCPTAPPPTPPTPKVEPKLEPMSMR